MLWLECGVARLSDTLYMSHMCLLTPYILPYIYVTQVVLGLERGFARLSDTLYMSHMCLLTPYICLTCVF